jgi:hypothetical protein
VIDERDPDRLCGDGDGVSERDVLRARSRIAAGMIVHEHDRARVGAQRDPQHVRRAYGEAVKAALCHAPCGA